MKNHTDMVDSSFRKILLLQDGTFPLKKTDFISFVRKHEFEIASTYLYCFYTHYPSPKGLCTVSAGLLLTDRTP